MFGGLLDGDVFSRQPPSVIFLTTTAVLWLSWRYWRFTIRPLLKPDEPKEYPYWIPFIGHMVGFLKDSESLYTKARLYFGNTREPFAIKVAGTTLYIVTSTHDVPLIYRNTVTLSFDEYIRDTVIAIGASKVQVDKIFASPQAIKELHGIDVVSEKPLIDRAKALYAQQFLPGPHLKDFWPVILSEISKGLEWSNLPKKAIVRETDSSKCVSLLTWTREALMEAATIAVFGPRLLELQPNLMEIFTKFDNESWKMNYQMPPSTCPEFYKNKGEIIAVLKRYFELPPSERQGEMWFVRNLEAYMRELQIPVDDIACFFLMPLWVTNSNAYKSAFWLLAHIFHDPKLYSAVKAEVDSVLASGQNDLAERLDECPQLLALWHEVLRHHVATASIRTVESDTKLGRYELKKGGRVLVPYHQLHIDEGAFGSTAKVFDSGRFLQKKDLSKSPSYRPFGGGITYCSGRIVARWEVFAFVAFALNRFEMKVVPGLEKNTAAFPKMDEQTPTLGMMPPAAGEDVYVEVSLRS